MTQTKMDSFIESEINGSSQKRKKLNKKNNSVETKNVYI
jgi:hypothetical protein